METEEFTSAKKSRTANLAQLTKLYNELERQMVSQENKDKVRQLYNNLCERFELFKTAHLNCLEVCDDSANIDALEASFISQKKNIEEFTIRYHDWKSQPTSCEYDNVSVISSSASVSSSRAQLRNAKLKRLVAEQKLRKFKEQQQIADRQHELESEKRALENRKQLLEREGELEEAKIEESVLEADIEDSTTGHLSTEPHIADDTIPKRTDISGSIGDSNNDVTRSSPICDKTAISTDETSAVSTTGSKSTLQLLNKNYAAAATDADIAMNSGSRVSGVTDISTLSSIDTAFRHLASTLQEGFNLPKPELLSFNEMAEEFRVRGGAWERLIRSTRRILKAVAGEQLLTDEKLVTLMAETERIMNDRPITKVSNDPKDPLALTPSMLLLMKSNTALPRGVFNEKESYAKRWWKQIQYLADLFWRRWICEYLTGLQLRQKWQRARADLRIDDVVLVAEDNVQRGQWPLGRVVKVTKGRDGHVRSCVVRIRNSEIIKPITKLCLLESD